MQQETQARYIHRDFIQLDQMENLFQIRHSHINCHDQVLQNTQPPYFWFIEEEKYIEISETKGFFAK